MTNNQHGQVPEALRLAEEISNLVCSSEAAAKTIAAAADELCRLHTNNLAEPQLNWLQEEVASYYSDGEFAHTKSLDAAQNVGDGLFTFCINEAGDAGDKPELINMLNRAINQLSALVDALETAP